MATNDDLPPDPSLRHSLWFRFWRGWRKAMIALALLVAVAWGTNPDASDHKWARLLRYADRLIAAGKVTDLSRHEQAEVSNVPGAHRVDWQLFSVTYLYKIRADSGMPARVVLLGPPLTIGAFGYVWVLGE